MTDEQITKACEGIYLSDFNTHAEYEIYLGRAIIKAAGGVVP